MTSAMKDDADHLAAYAEHLVQRAKELVTESNRKREEWESTKREAIQLLMRARMAIKEAQAQIK